MSEVTFVCCRVLWEAVDYEPEERALQEVNKPLLSDAIRRYQIIYLTCVRVMIFPGSRNGAWTGICTLQKMITSTGCTGEICIPWRKQVKRVNVSYFYQSCIPAGTEVDCVFQINSWRWSLLLKSITWSSSTPSHPGWTSPSQTLKRWRRSRGNWARCKKASIII